MDGNNNEAGGSRRAKSEYPGGVRKRGARATTSCGEGDDCVEAVVEKALPAADFLLGRRMWVGGGVPECVDELRDSLFIILDM